MIGIAANPITALMSDDQSLGRFTVHQNVCETVRRMDTALMFDNTITTPNCCDPRPAHIRFTSLDMTPKPCPQRFRHDNANTTISNFDIH